MNHIICGKVALAASHGKSAIALARPVLTQAFEPGDEGIDVLRDVRHQRRDLRTNRLDERVFGLQHAALLADIAAPTRLRQRRLQSAPIEFRQFALETCKAWSIELRGNVVHSSRGAYMTLLLLSVNGERHDRDPVDAVVGRAFEFLPEDVRIDLFVAVSAVSPSSRGRTASKNVSVPSTTGVPV